MFVTVETKVALHHLTRVSQNMAPNIELCNLQPLTPFEDITNFAAHLESFHNTFI
jgi:hypothetical protein